MSYVPLTKKQFSLIVNNRINNSGGFTIYAAHRLYANTYLFYSNFVYNGLKLPLSFDYSRKKNPEFDTNANRY